MMLKIFKVESPRYSDANRKNIDALVTFHREIEVPWEPPLVIVDGAPPPVRPDPEVEVIGPLPYHATPLDEEAHGQQLWQGLSDGLWGAVADPLPPKPPVEGGVVAVKQN